MVASLSEIRHDNTIAIIDGNSLMHRAYHAVPPTMNAPDGRPTNACFGFISMLLKLIDEFNPNAIVCAFDAGKPAFRMEALEQYKAQRPPMDQELRDQFPMIEDLLTAMNIPVVRIQGWEGDDILGTLSARADASGKHALLVTGDKDIFQLVTENVNVVATRKGLSEISLYDPEAVLDRYGVMPAQVPDFLGLKGDTSDNIPGVPGVGEKTAAKLLQEYGDLDGLYEHAEEIKGKMGQNIRENRQSAYDSKTVATIVRDVPIELDLDTVSFPSFDPTEVRAAFGKLRFNSHLAKVLALEGGATASSPSADVPAAKPLLGEAGSDCIAVCLPLLEGDAAAAFLDAAIAAGEWLGIRFDEGEGPALFGESGELYVAGAAGVARFGGDEFPVALAALAEEGKIVSLDAKTLLHKVYPVDSGEDTRVDFASIDPERIFDVGVAAYLLDSGRKSFELNALLDEFLAAAIPEKLDVRMSQPAAAAACTLALREPLLKLLEEDSSLDCYRTIEMPLLPVLCQMERTGVDVDIDFLEQLSEQTQSQLDELTKDIYRNAGEEFNIDSPKQLSTVLFDKLKLPAKKKTRTGFSTDVKVLADLAKIHPLPQLIIEYRELAKIKSTYMDALPRLIAAGDKRLHTTFNQTVTATGRLSSSDPNLQNIPVRTDFGRQIRMAFRPKDSNYIFLSADYSQIELRLLAHLSGDNGLIAAFTSGADFHTATAARVFGVPVEQVDQHMRSRAKAVNFGIVYGQQAFGLSQSLGCSFKEAQDMIDRDYEAYPRVRGYLDETVEFARRERYVSTMFGRKRHIPEMLSHNAQIRAFGERTAMNHPMQGSAADIIKLAMIEVAKKLADSDLRVRLCLQVHDELDFEVHEDDAAALGQLVKNCMENVVKLSVPLEVSVESGPTWADAK